MVLLIGCCIIIYSMVMIFLPKNYQTELEHQVSADFYDMVEMLERDGWEASSDSLLEFSMKNNATVKINDENNNNVFSVNFANMEDGEIASSSSPSMSCSATFVQGGRTYQLSAIVSLVAVSQSYDILIKLLPFIASRAATTIRPRTAGTAARRSRASCPSRPCRRRTCARRSSLTR